MNKLLPHLWVFSLVVATLLPPALPARAFSLATNSQQIAGPDRAPNFSSWLAAMQAWRTQKRAEIGYTGANYDQPALQWTQKNFVQPQMMVQDRAFFDPIGSLLTSGARIEINTI